MSSTGVRDSNSDKKRAIKGLILNEEQFIQSLRVFANTSTLSGLGSVGSEISNRPKDSASNHLAISGGGMIGPFALGSSPKELSIDIDNANTINIGIALEEPKKGGSESENLQYSSNVQIKDTPTSTTLTIIKGAAFNGQFLILRTFAPSPITIAQATQPNGGNIQTPTGSDVILGDLQIRMLIFDASLIIEENTGGTWRLL